MSRKASQNVRSPVPVVAFDFDGTLTWKDSFTDFLISTCGRTRVGMAFIMQPNLGLHYLATRDRGRLKAHLLYHLLGRIYQSELETLIDAYVARVGMSLFRPDALKTWQSFDRGGLQRVIVTASPDLLVRALARQIGADRVIGSRLAFDPDGRLLPDLNGPNCRAEEKMRRLKAVFGDAFELQAAYGDTSGDKDMLAAAKEAHYRVFTQKP